MTEQRPIDISTNTILRVIFFILFLAFLYIIRDVLFILLFAVVIASAVSPVAYWLQQRKIPRTFGVILVYILLIGAIVFITYIIAVPLSSEIQQLASNIPEYIVKISDNFEKVRQDSAYPTLTDNIEKFLLTFGSQIAKSSSQVFATTVNILGGMISVIVIFVISFYLSVQEKGVENFLNLITPANHSAYVQDLWIRTQKKLGQWLFGQLLLGIIVGLIVFLGLSFLGIPYALTLGIIAGILELVPYVGPILATIPAIVIAFLKSPIFAVWVLIFYTVVQQLENNVLVPKIMQRTVGLNPVVVIIALLIGGKLAGIIGIILAVPVAAVIAEFWKDLSQNPLESSVRD